MFVILNEVKDLETVLRSKTELHAEVLHFGCELPSAIRYGSGRQESFVILNEVKDLETVLRSKTELHAEVLHFVQDDRSRLSS